MTTTSPVDADLTTLFNISLVLCCDSGTPSTSLPVAIDLVIVVLLAILGAISVVGNAAIVWLVLVTPTLRAAPHNRFVVQLALCDLMTSLLNAPPIVVSMVIGRWCLGEMACRLSGASTTFFGVASAVTLAAVSLNRFYMVAHTTKGSKMFTVQRTNVLIAVIWLLSIMCCIPPVFGWSRYEFRPGKAICTIRWSTSPSYTVSVLSIGAFVPFVIMVTSYINIFKKVRESNQRIWASVAGAPFSADTNRQQSSMHAGLESFSGVYPNDVFALYSGSASVDGAAPHCTSSDPTAIGRDLRKSTSGLQLSSSVDKGTCRTRCSSSSRHHSDRMTVVFTMPAAGPQGIPLWTTENVLTLENVQDRITRRSLSNIHDCSTVSAEPTFSTDQKSSALSSVESFEPHQLPPSESMITSSNPARRFGSAIAKRCDRQWEISVSSLSQRGSRRSTRAWTDDQVLLSAPNTVTDSKKTLSPVEMPNGSPKLVLPKRVDHGTPCFVVSNPLDCPTPTTSDPSIEVFQQPNAIGCRRWSGTSIRVSLPLSTTSSLTGKSATGHPKRIERQSTCGRLGVRRISSLSVGGATLVQAAPFYQPAKLNKQELLRKRSSRRSRFRDEIKVSLAMFVIVVVFLVSWTPISLVNVVETLGFEKLIAASVDHGAVAMMFLQPAVNPIVYGAMNRNFRDRFYNILCNCFGKAKRTTAIWRCSAGNTC